MLTTRLLTLSLTALCIISCSSTQDEPYIPEPQLVGISFGGNNGTWQDAPTSRGSEIGLENMFKSFRVWGYKTTTEDKTAPLVVIDGYNVEYKLGGAGTTTTNTADCEYVGITNKNSSTPQTIKYWDYSASSYRFFAYTPADVNNITPSKSATNTTQTADAFSIPYTYNKDATVKDVPYISELWYGDNTATSALYGKCVTMKFSPLIAKVRFKFSYPANTKKIVINDIKFRDSRFIDNPSAADTPLKGTITATYPLTGAPSSMTPQFAWQTSSDADATGLILFDTPYEETSDAIHILTDNTKYGKWYYVPPFNIVASTTDPTKPYQQGAYTITANIDGNMTSATVPAEYMQWKAGYQYTYIFMITEAGSIIAFSNLLVEEWRPGTNIKNNGNGTAGW